MNKLVIDNARLIFKNFSGKGDNYNREGDRNFAVIIDDIYNPIFLSIFGGLFRS